MERGFALVDELFRDPLNLRSQTNSQVAVVIVTMVVAFFREALPARTLRQAIAVSFPTLIIATAAIAIAGATGASSFSWGLGRQVA